MSTGIGVMAGEEKGTSLCLWKTIKVSLNMELLPV